MSTMAEVAAGQVVQTDKCISEAFAGGLVTANTFVLVLLNLALGAAALTRAATGFWGDLSACETVGVAGYTKGTGIVLTGANHTAIAGNMGALDFANVSLDNAEFTSDAYAIVRSTGNLATSPVLALGKWDVTKTPAGTGVANFTATVVNAIKFTAGPPA